MIGEVHDDVSLTLGLTLDGLGGAGALGLLKICQRFLHCSHTTQHCNGGLVWQHHLRNAHTHRHGASQAGLLQVTKNGGLGVGKFATLTNKVAECVATDSPQRTL